MSSSAPNLVDIPLLDWVIGQPEAGSSFENHRSSNFTDLAAGVNGSSYVAENIQMVDPEVSPPWSVFTRNILNLVLQAMQSALYTASPPFMQQLSMGRRALCQWKDGDKPVCGKPIDYESTPEHLSKHGVEHMSRGIPTKCHWAGCRRKKFMNRESIVRHVREVHLREKRRSSKKGTHPKTG